MKKLYFLFAFLFAGIFAFGQIYAPEGVNMPGQWNGWTNYPQNAYYFFRTATDTVNDTVGTVSLITGLYKHHYQTKFNTLSTGGQVPAGSYEFLFTSGPQDNAYKNKWANVTVKIDTIQTYTYNGANNNVITLDSDKYYVVNFEDNDYTDTRAIFMEFSGDTVGITGVTQNPDTSSVQENQDVTVTINLSGTPPSEQIFVLRYTNDNWASWRTVLFTLTGDGTTATATIPGQPADTTVSYYVFSTQHDAYYNNDFSFSQDWDLVTVNFDNNGGKNYTYKVQKSTGVISNQKSNILLYPNPASNEVTIVNGRGADLEIADLQGRILRHYTNLAENARIKVYDLTPGVYLFNIQKKGKRITKKVTIK